MTTISENQAKLFNVIANCNRTGDKIIYVYNGEFTVFAVKSRSTFGSKSATMVTYYSTTHWGDVANITAKGEVSWSSGGTCEDAPASLVARAMAKVFEDIAEVMADAEASGGWAKACGDE